MHNKLKELGNLSKERRDYLDKEAKDRLCEKMDRSIRIQRGRDNAKEAGLHYDDDTGLIFRTIEDYIAYKAKGISIL